jgi:hypothetical protein
LRALEEMSVTIHRLPKRSKTRLSGEEKPRTWSGSGPDGHIGPGEAVGGRVAALFGEAADAAVGVVGVVGQGGVQRVVEGVDLGVLGPVAYTVA